jgi:hypothetical protein
MFYVIEQNTSPPLYMADSSCGWTQDIDLAAKWGERAPAEDVWRRQPCQFRGISAVVEQMSGIIRDLDDG